MAQRVSDVAAALIGILQHFIDADRGRRDINYGSGVLIVGPSCVFPDLTLNQKRTA